MPVMNRYERQDMLDNLADATRDHTGRRHVVMWVCDCGCDIAQWFQRTSRGLAFTQQAWPEGVTPKVLVFESLDEVDAFVRGTSEFMRLRTMREPQKKEAVEARIKSFEKAVWSAWADA